MKSGGSRRTLGIARIMPLLLLMLAGCATSIPGSMKKAADTEFTLEKAKTAGDEILGKKVIWGGRIVRAMVQKEGTLIEILQSPLDSSEKPEKHDLSQGRFLAFKSEFLDPLVYRENREVTVLGAVLRFEKHPIGEMMYRYPLLSAEKIHLWEEAPAKIHVYHQFPPHLPGYPYPYGYSPYGWW